MSFAVQRLAQYHAECDAANEYFKTTHDLKGYQDRFFKARESWQSEVTTHYRNPKRTAELREALAQADRIGGRVYATLDTGETVRMHTVGALYALNDITGAPAEPLVARIVGDFIVHTTTIADLVRQA